MVRLYTLFTVAALMAGSLVPALAQNAPIDIRTGLWEFSTQRSTTGMPQMPAMPSIPPAALAQMPPAQRAQIEAALKARQSRHGAGAGQYASKVCVTAATLRKGAAFGMPPKMNCRRTKDMRTAHGWDLQEVCHQDGGRQTMNIHYEVLTRDTVKGTVNIAMHEHGHDITMKQTTHGRWLAAGCGKVKPIE